MALLILFRVEDRLFGLEGTHVDRIVPLVHLRPIPHTPEFVRGLFNLQGRIVPVIDLCSLLADRPAKAVMSTRIVVVDALCADGRRRRLGLVVEKTVGIRTVDPARFEPPAMITEGAPYLGPMWNAPEGLVQIIEFNRLLSPPLQQHLFAPCEEVE